jgi:histidine ammonia-lyase
MSSIFVLKPGELSLKEIKNITRQKLKIKLDDSAIEKISAAEQTINNVLEQNKTVYGINTGFGALASERISQNDLKQLQTNLVVSHACGTGPLLSDEIVSILVLLKINSLARGYSGIRLSVIENLIHLFNKEIYPCIPSKGSVGASGDLAPLAHMSLPLLGLGNCRYNGEIIDSSKALEIAGIQAIELAPKEGLALLNGLQASTAVCLSAFFKTETLFETAILAGAMSVDAVCGSDVPFDQRIHEVRGHKSQENVAALFRRLLKDSQIRASHISCSRVQDPYSLRCQPQVMGAVLNQIEFVGQTLQIEANAVSDNPLIFPEQQDIISGGNFHGEIIAFAADNLALSIAEMGAIAERRIALLIDKNFSQLPAFLVKEGGINSGFMIAHVTAASCASENKALASPRSVDSLPTSANQEDHVSMATTAALRLHEMLDNTASILAIELLAAAQGLDFRKPMKSSEIINLHYEKIRSMVASYDKDRYFAPDIEIVKQMISNNEFVLSDF